MEAYLFHIESINETTINLYLLSPRMKVTVNDLHNPCLYPPTPELNHCPSTTFTNIFHPKLPSNVDLIRTKLIRKNQPLFREFTSPIEHFMLERGIKGPGLIKLNNVNTTVDNINYASKDNITFLKHADLPSIRVGVLLVHENQGIINGFYLRLESGIYEDKNKTEDEILRSIRNNISGTDLILVFNLNENVIKKLEIKGAIICDVYLMAQNLMKARDYSIEELTLLLLTGNEETKKKQKTDQEMCESEQAIKILQIFDVLDILELSKQISEICMCPLSKALQNNRAERIEYLLLHELYNQKYLFPYKKGKESTYEGGLVLTPETGFYENMVILLDFNSLYPSIIQEFEVCFSTVGLDDKIEPSTKPAILPSVISILVNRRKNIKNLLKKTHGAEKKKLDIRQKAIKLTANSIYGVLGCSFSRFSNYKMASFITENGRNLLREAKLIAEEQLNMKVIYGDTDSIMIDTGLTGVNLNYQAAIDQGNCLREKINAKYKNIEIEVEHVFKKLILYAKKKYGALVLDSNLETHLETKGLDFIRRDYANVANDIVKDVFELILVDMERHYSSFYTESYQGYMTDNNFIRNNGNIHLVEKVISKIRDYKNNLHSLPKNKFIINTLLKKDPSQYMKTGVLPHVALALRMGTYKKNDIINYVIGKPQGNNTSSINAYHVSERFLLDYDYYVKNQILPCLARVLRIFDGISLRDIFKMFGIEKALTEDYQNLQKITIMTPCCQSVQEPSKTCLHCMGRISESFYKFKAFSLIKMEVSKLYNSQKHCKDCKYTTRNIIVACIYCNTKLEPINKNKSFHDFLDRLINSFHAFENIVEKIERLASTSDYRMINLVKYFPLESE